MEELPAPTPSLAELEAAKVAARQALLAQAPEGGQAIANQTLHPQLWTLADSSIWKERLPRLANSFDEAQLKQ